VIPKAEGSYEVQLEKVDTEGNVITTSEANFKYRLPGQSEQTGSTTNGILNLGTVKITSVGNKDIITIEEIKSPEGYNKLIESLTIQVEKAISEGKYVATSASITAGNTTDAKVSLSGNVITVTVTNEKKEFDLALRKYI